MIHLIVSSGKSLRVDRFEVPFSDIQRKSTYSELSGVLSQLLGSAFAPETHTVFRIRDEKILDPDAKVGVTSEGNTGILVVPKFVVAEFENEHLAFTYLYSQIRRRIKGDPPNKSLETDA